MRAGHSAPTCWLCTKRGLVGFTMGAAVGKWRRGLCGLLRACLGGRLVQPHGWDATCCDPAHACSPGALLCQNHSQVPSLMRPDVPGAPPLGLRCHFARRARLMLASWRCSREQMRVRPWVWTAAGLRSTCLLRQGRPGLKECWCPEGCWCLQVEHGITELTCAVDLVQWMLQLGVPGLQVWPLPWQAFWALTWVQLSWKPECGIPWPQVLLLCALCVRCEPVHASPDVGSPLLRRLSALRRGPA